MAQEFLWPIYVVDVASNGIFWRNAREKLRSCHAHMRAKTHLLIFKNSLTNCHWFEQIDLISFERMQCEKQKDSLILKSRPVCIRCCSLFWLDFKRTLSFLPQTFIMQTQQTLFPSSLFYMRIRFDYAAFGFILKSEHNCHNTRKTSKTSSSHCRSTSY